MESFRQQFSTGYIDLNDDKLNVSPEQSSLIVSILSAGTFFGALAAAPAGDMLGRKRSLVIAVAIFSFGALLQTVATQIPILVAGRQAQPVPFAYAISNLLQVFRWSWSGIHLGPRPIISV